MEIKKYISHVLCVGLVLSSAGQLQAEAVGRAEEAREKMNLFQRSLKSFQRTLDRYNRCIRGKCSDAEKQKIKQELKSAAKKTAVAGLVVVGIVGAVWLSKEVFKQTKMREGIRKTKMREGIRKYVAEKFAADEEGRTFLRSYPSLLQNWADVAFIYSITLGKDFEEMPASLLRLGANPALVTRQGLYAALEIQNIPSSSVEGFVQRFEHNYREVLGRHGIKYEPGS